MNHLLFTELSDYGAGSVEYCIDEKGPYIIVSRYSMMFHGPGDHIGEPGSLESSRTKRISFSDLREAAVRFRHPEYADISEKNWLSLISKNNNA